jgi:catechol 2,3-dioxygenase-like lactoylglutathione lyase family enzyme
MIQDAFPVLHISSIAASYEFYSQQLGFRLAFGAPPDGRLRDPVYMGFVRDGGIVHVSSHAGDGVAGSAVYFLVDDVDALHAEFVKRRVPIHLAPTDQTWGLREMYVLDPDKNSIRFGSRVKR